MYRLPNRPRRKRAPNPPKADGKAEEKAEEKAEGKPRRKDKKEAEKLKEELEKAKADLAALNDPVPAAAGPNMIISASAPNGKKPRFTMTRRLPPSPTS